MDSSLKDYLVPTFKPCRKCSFLLSQLHFISKNYYFYCFSCQVYTFWANDSILSKMSIPFTTFEKILFLYLENQPPSQAFDILHYDFVNEKVSNNTVLKYYSIFNQICISFYEEELNTKMLEGIIELDETHLFSEKKTHAISRSYALSSIWLVGMRKRGSKEFFIIPVEKRDETTLISIILRHIKRKSTIYTDSYSCYVNNNCYPKKSKLTEYKYIHSFVNHKYRFVSLVFEEVHTNTIESLWKNIKSDMGKWNIKSTYLAAISRYYFMHMLSKEEQQNVLIRGLYSKGIFGLENFKDS